ncbi:MAG: response regulator [Candidatus Eisenbacteria bacterium]|nr:response regulator [Candidatus Eisenbacteria bacterium]
MPLRERLAGAGWAPIRRLRAFIGSDIRHRFTLLVGLLTFFITTFLGVAFVSKTLDMLGRELEMKGAAISRYVAYNAWYGVFTGDARSLQSATRGALEEPDVAYVLIVGNGGDLLHESYRDPGLRAHVLGALPLRASLYDTRARTTEGPKGERYSQIVTPILRRRTDAAEDESLLWDAEDRDVSPKSAAPDEFFGYVVVGLSHENMNAHLRTVIPQIVLAALSALLVSLLFLLFSLRVITRPLKRIARTAQLIAGGDLTQRVAVTSKDEIGTLASSFNTMVRSLRERDRRLQANRVALETSNRELKRLDQRKSVFLANMSHELRTPLNAIIGFSEVLRDRCFGELTEKQGEYISDIWESGHHLLSLINDILDLSKIEAGMMRVERSRFGPENLIRRSVVMIKEKAGQHGIRIEVETEDLPGLIEADERKLKQVIYNLLANAVKFTPEGGRIGIRAAAAGGTMTVTVWDTGIGIPEKDRERIFDKFEQVDDSEARRYEGTGLGLSLTRSMVQLMGGTLHVESEEGKGSRFIFTLPYREVAEAGESAGDSSRIDSSGVARLFREPVRGPRIHLLEDEKKTADLFAAYLRSAGYRVETSGTGGEAMRRIVESPPDAILLDLLLPDTDGWEVLTQLKENPATREIPVVIGSVMDEKERGFSLGARDYLVKPFGRDQLLGAFDRVWEKTGENGEERQILVIDDDPTVSKLVEAVLGGRSVTVRSAPDGETGIREAVEQLPDLILLDFLLPDLPCPQVVQTIRSDPAARDIPIILITARDLSEEEKGQLRGEIELFSRKNDLNREALVDEIDALLRERRTEEHEVWALTAVDGESSS